MARGKAADLAKFPQLRQPRPLYEQLADLIRHKIADGELAPGERLPAEVGLASALGVGRPSLREALKILQALGVISIRHGAGIFVSRAGVDEIARRLTPVPTLPPDRLRSLFEVRKTLECQAAAWAAQRATDEEVAALGREVGTVTSLVDSLAEDGGEPPMPRLAELDKAFHRQLALSAGNPALICLLDTLEGMIGEIMTYSLGIPGRAVQSVYDHRRIYQAVAVRKPLAAARCMFAHIDSVQRGVFSLRATAQAVETPGSAASAEGETLLVLTYQEATPQGRE